MRYWLAMAALLSAAPARAQTAAGAEAADFLLFDGGGRATALGGAYTALAADANALLYNPGGLAFQDGHEVTFMHNQFVQGLNQEYAALTTKSGFGAQLNYVSLGDIQRTTISNQTGDGTSFGVSDLALEGGYGRALSDELGLGAGAKYIRETIDNVTASGFAVDFGALYRPHAAPGLSLGAALLNLGPELSYLTAKEKLPTQLRLGAGYSFKALGNRNTAAFDLSKTPTDSLRVGVGAETLLVGHLAVRLGFTTRNDTDIGLTTGVGWSDQSLSADYAFVPMGELGQAHRISLSLRWGQDDRLARQSP